jgi:hypothetical protein
MRFCPATVSVAPRAVGEALGAAVKVMDVLPEPEFADGVSQAALLEAVQLQFEAEAVMAMLPVPP